MDLTLVLTHDCNLACSYCYAGAKRRVAMDLATARRAIDWALPRCAGRLLLGYFGGEPLLEWGLIQAIHPYAQAAARATGVELKGTLTSNGSLLDGERMRWLHQQGVVVGISIDGPPAVHDAQRPLKGGGGSSARCLVGLQAALALQPLCQTISVINPRNVAAMPETVDFLLGQGVRVLALSPDYGADWDLGDLEAHRQGLERIGERFLVEYRAGRDCYIDPLDAKIISRIKGGLAACDRCDAGGGELALAPSGTWYPCERLVGDDGPAESAWQLGNLHRSIDGGPDPDRVAALQARHARQTPECSACAHRSRCMNQCACSNIWMSGDPAEPGGVLCALEQNAIAVADRVAETLFAERNGLFLAKQYRLGL